MPPPMQRAQSPTNIPSPLQNENNICIKQPTFQGNTYHVCGVSNRTKLFSMLFKEETEGRYIYMLKPTAQDERSFFFLLVTYRRCALNKH